MKRPDRRELLIALGAGVGAAALAAADGTSTELATMSGSPATGYTATLKIAVQA